jgi:hypothetical protein
MANSIQTFFTYKYLKDAAGVQYVIFISHHTNRISTVVNPSRTGTFQSHSVQNLIDGSRELVFRYSGISQLDITFEDRQTKSITIADISKGNELQAPFASLRRSFSFDSNQGTKTGYNISDALYYDTDLGYREVNILPSSTNTHLDTSNRSDFYYLTSGTTAFIISSDLQNQFLEGIGYNNPGSEAGTLGRIRGKFDDNSELSIITTPGDPRDLSELGPKVYGGLVSLTMVARSENELRVCLDPNSTNYYLSNCIGNDIPCVNAGGSFPNDCFGTALTSDLINSFPAFDGGCCTSVTGCESFSVDLGSINEASLDQTNGSIVVTVTGGTANYTAVVDDIELQNPALTFSTQTTNSIATDTFTISSLLPGTYEITVTDSNSGTNCSESLRFSIPLKGAETGDGAYGCKTDSNAINYDTSVTTHSDKACVFCNATTGQLEIPATGEVLGSFVYSSGLASTTSATSNPDGTSQSDGTISYPGVTYAGPFNVLTDPNNLDFDPSIEFNSDQASPIDYQLYKLNPGFNSTSLGQYILEGQNAKTLLTSNSTAVGSLVSSTGASNVFTGLDAGSYVVLVTYDADGTPNGSPEEEQCYYITRVYNVGQGGCTDETADNYNADATFDDGSCTFTRLNLDGEIECGDLKFGVDVSCDIEGSDPLTISVLPIADTNSGIQDAIDNGFTLTHGFNAGTTYPAQPGNAWLYTWHELLCWGLYNVTSQGYTPSLPAGTGSNVTPFHLNTNGNLATGIAGPSHMLIINHSIVMGDGTLYNANPESTLQQLLDGEDLTNPITNPFCNSVALYGIPTGVEFSFRYGTGDVYEFTTTQFVPFTAAQIDAIKACCSIEPETVEGCTDPTALNYNPAAVIDDGSCDYPDVDPEIPGCTDPLASNYNANANIDDGSCQYTATGYWVPLNCYKCEFSTNANAGYSTQVDCESNLATNTDCCIIEDFNIPHHIMSSGGSDSLLDSTTGLCDDLETGTLSGTIPNLTNTGVNNLTGIVNNLSFIWVVEGPAGYYGNWFTGPISPADINNQFANLSSADLIDYSYPSNDGFELTDLSSGIYASWIHFFGQANNPNGVAGDLVPPGSLIQTAFCNTISNMQEIVLEPCTGVTPGCTDPNANNYNSSATQDDGTCTYDPIDPGACECSDGTFSQICCPPDPVCGCMDPNALNYNPIASYYDATECPCDYGPDGPESSGTTEEGSTIDSSVSACIPRGNNRLIEYVSECIARSGHRSYIKHITGLGKSCSDMDTWKIIMIQDLLNRQGLPCVFNCTDNETPELGDAVTDCRQLWKDSGQLFWSPGSASGFILGSVVKRPYIPNPNNLSAPVFIAISNTGLDIDPFSDNPASGWQRCITKTISSEPKDYLPNFLRFAQEYCKDCGIPAYRTVNDSSVNVTDTFTSGGTTLTNNGASFNNTNNNTNLGPVGPS